MARPRPPRPPVTVDPDNPPMHPAEERRLRRELESRIDHLWAIAERRRLGAAAPPSIDEA